MVGAWFDGNSDLVRLPYGVRARAAGVHMGGWVLAYGNGHTELRRCGCVGAEGRLVDVGQVSSWDVGGVGGGR